MRLKIKIKFGSKTSVKKGEEYEVTLTQAPEKGKANKQLIQVLSKYLKIPKTELKLVSGAKSRHKIVEIINRS